MVGIGQRNLKERPCIMCGGKRDSLVAYTTNQGKRSQRLEPRCRECGNARRKALHGADRKGSREACRKWREANPRYMSEYSRERQKDPEVRSLKAFHQRLRKARLRSGQPDDPRIKAIYKQAMIEEQIIQVCPVFDLPELGKKMHVDHVMPLSKGGKHVIENLQILPIGLNMRKGVTYRA